MYLLPRLVAAGNVSRIGLARVVVEDGVPVGVERQGVVLEPDRSWEQGIGNAGVEDPRITWIERPRPARHDLRRLRAARPADGARGVDRSPRVATSRTGALHVRRRPRHRSEPVPQQGRGLLPRAGRRAGRRALLRGAAPPDVGPDRDEGRSEASSCRRASTIRGSRSGSATSPVEPSRTICRRSRCGAGIDSSPARVSLRGHQDRRRTRRRCACPRAGCVLHHGVTGAHRARRSTTSRTSTTPRARCCSTPTIPRS